ncbi:hypothetical protein FRC17_000315 [Serendipita sp. 399]|nr:hypothetical protein FRC17_000315 [Serendipita sp. 399]
MRFFNIVTYLTLASATAVFAIPVHRAQDESLSERTTGSEVAHNHHDGYAASGTVAGGVLNLPVPKDVQTKGPELTKRNLHTGPLTAQQHAAERERHLGDQVANEQMSQRFLGTAGQARNALQAERASANPNPQLLDTHSRAVKYNVAKSMEMSERAKASGAGAAYHGAMQTAARIAALPNPNQHDAAALQRAHQAAGDMIHAHNVHTANADRSWGQAINWA